MKCPRLGRGTSVLPMLVAFACSHTPHVGVLVPPTESPPEVAEACELATDRCSRCHPLSRVQQARVRDAQHWAWYVTRMRLQPRSGISVADERPIVRCLVARSFGLAALEALPR